MDNEFVEFTFTGTETIPEDTHTLWCDNKNLTSLPTLPPRLDTLYCNHNQLTTLPPLPRTLQILYCQGNNLVSLPELPEGLRYLNCSTNQLTILPKVMPSNLWMLDCSGNQLSEMPELHQRVKVTFSGNRFPYFSSIQEYYMWKATTTLIPNYDDKFQQILNRLDRIEAQIKMLPKIGEWYLEAEARVRNTSITFKHG